MKLIEQSYEILAVAVDALKMIELAGRTCYKSEDKITDKSAEKFVDMLTKRGHLSVIEHPSVTVKFITNRGVTHELVRHRLCSFSQESTRYVKYDGNMEFIKPVWLDMTLDETQNYPHETWTFMQSLERAEMEYQSLLGLGWRPEQAREVLPNALKTEIVVTANFREWMHIFNLRCSPKAHPQIRDLMVETYLEFLERWTPVFKHCNVRI